MLVTDQLSQRNWSCDWLFCSSFDTCKNSHYHVTVTWKKGVKKMVSYIHEQPCHRILFKTLCMNNSVSMQVLATNYAFADKQQGSLNSSSLNKRELHNFAFRLDHCYPYGQAKKPQSPEEGLGNEEES